MVTGGAGFIGSNFIHYWLKEYPDDFVINYDLLTYAGNLDNLLDVHDDPRYAFVCADICDAAAVALARDNKIPVIVFSIRQAGAFVDILNGAGRATIVANA